MTRPAINGRQAAVLAEVVRYQQVHGYPPTLREIGRAVGLASPSSVRHQLDVLEARGYVARGPWGTPRALVVVP